VVIGKKIAPDVAAIAKARQKATQFGATRLSSHDDDRPAVKAWQTKTQHHVAESVGIGSGSTYYRHKKVVIGKQIEPNIAAIVDAKRRQGIGEARRDETTINSTVVSTRTPEEELTRSVVAREVGIGGGSTYYRHKKVLTQVEQEAPELLHGPRQRSGPDGDRMDAARPLGRLERQEEEPMTQCTATSKRSHDRCQRHAAIGRTTCSMHGGTASIGPASPEFKHGRYSNALPTRLLERYRESLNDPELLNGRAEIAVIDTRLVELLTGLDSAGSAQLWRALRDAYRALQTAQRTRDPSALRLALAAFGAIVERGDDDRATWSEAIHLVGVRQRLVESERKRLVEMQHMITSTEAMTLVTAVSESVRTHVTDETTLRAISADLLRLLNRHGAEGSGLA